MIKKLFLLLLVLISIPVFVNAGLFDVLSQPPGVAPGAVCLKTGCIMTGPINMSGNNIYDAVFVNATFDGVTYINATQVLNPYWLNESDQRYNDTLMIIAVNNSLYLALNDYYLNSNPQGFINSSYANTTYLLQIDQRYNETNLFFALNNSKLDYWDQRYNDTVLIYLINDSLYTYIYNETQARINNDTYLYNLIQSINQSLQNITVNSSNILNPIWVNKTGDSMTGDLNMSNQSIWDVNILSVHNITGRSPIYVSSDIISSGTFYGDINGVNGTIFGMTITNGTISNMHVQDSALFNTSLLPELNNTWSLGNDNLSWKNFYVTNLVASNISSPDLTNIYNLITGLNNTKLDYWDQRYNDTVFILNALTNYYNKTEVDSLIASVNQTTYINITNNITVNITNNITQNITIINNITEYYNDTNLTLAIQAVNASIKQPIGPYLEYNTSNFWINESALNHTIINLSKNRPVTLNLTCITVSGSCGVISSQNITYLITEVKIIPTSPLNVYRSQVVEYPITTNIIDRNLIPHIGTWDIQKNYAINGQLQVNITNAVVDELFTAQIIYITNGIGG